MIPLLEATDGVQCSVHPPSSFIRTHRQRLLPSWQSEPQSVVIILQRCAVSLAHCTAQTDHQKDVLRDRFFHIGNDIRHHIHGIHHEVELFDPKSGYPVISSPGSLHLDDVAVACHMLHYAVSTQGTCTYLLHPQWRDAVYPSTLISDAPIEKVREVLSALVLPSEYAEAPPIRRNLQFCYSREAIAPALKTV
ncbi:MAG: methylmalonic aciduria and homocystinuria type D protein, partial [Leptolyngbyaceae bacterium]|nr:methylmalonic aciduria and homocystinuria type D protein [Leptolyngbyaceae bacterium]